MQTREEIVKGCLHAVSERLVERLFSDPAKECALQIFEALLNKIANGASQKELITQFKTIISSAVRAGELTEMNCYDLLEIVNMRLNRHFELYRYLLRQDRELDISATTVTISLPEEIEPASSAMPIELVEIMDGVRDSFEEKKVALKEATKEEAGKLVRMAENVTKMMGLDPDKPIPLQDVDLEMARLQGCALQLEAKPLVGMPECKTDDSDLVTVISKKIIQDAVRLQCNLKVSELKELVSLAILDADMGQALLQAQDDYCKKQQQTLETT